MRLELAEKLICPASHEATPLIVVAHQTIERDLRGAQLGCMLCHRAGEIKDGSVLLGASRTAPSDASARDASEEALLRLAALLGLSEPNVLLLLGPSFASVASQLSLRHEAIIAVYDALGPSPADLGYVQVAEDRVPFANATFAAAALDVSMSAALTADVVRCVQVGGRIVGDSGVPVPAGLRELARDSEAWVGEVEAAASPVIPLRRA